MILYRHDNHILIKPRHEANVAKLPYSCFCKNNKELMQISVKPNFTM